MDAYSTWANELNQSFYAEVADTFDATRKIPWQGWDELIPALDELYTRLREDESLKVLDLACGNFRFERWLCQSGFSRVDALGIDTSDCLAAMPPKDSSYLRRDVLTLSKKDELPKVHLAVCFGFMHHVPHEQLRLKIMHTMAEQVRPEGLMALSFWQFLNDERLSKKAVDTTRRYLIRHPEHKLAHPRDYLLTWQHQDTLRFCHAFTKDEVGSLCSAFLSQHPNFTLQEAYEAEGATQNLNAYVIFKRA